MKTTLPLIRIDMHTALTSFVFCSHARGNHGLHEKLLCSAPAIFSDQRSSDTERTSHCLSSAALSLRQGKCSEGCQRVPKSCESWCLCAYIQYIVVLTAVECGESADGKRTLNGLWVRNRSTHSSSHRESSIRVLHNPCILQETSSIY